MSSDNALVLFRNDLRVRDNEALSRAISNHPKVLLLYVFDDRQFRFDRWGFEKTGPFRAQFLLESVRDLKDQIEELDGTLIVRSGLTEEVVKELVAQQNVTKVYMQKEVTAEEVQVEEAISQIADVVYTWGHTLYHIKDIPYKIADFPEIFTSFRKKTEKLGTIRDLIPAPDSLRSTSFDTAGDLPQLSDLGIDIVEADPRRVLDFKGGTTYGQQRIDHYFWETQALSSYKWTRNGLVGKDYSSKLSPWLANGSISPREIYWQVKKYEEGVKKNVSTYWLIFELIWRDFFRFHSAKWKERLFLLQGITEWPPKMSQNKKYFDEWRLGNTKHPFINANMKELLLTGWMSNRGRQVVASNLVNDYKIDWRMGAAWFESMLLDYDPCSNYGNWQYVAHVGTDPRKDRYFNIKSQQERYDPKGEFVGLWME